MDDYGTTLFSLNILSIVSSSLVLIAYLCSDKIKTFGVKQVCKLCIYDVLFSSGNLFIKNSILDSSKNEVYCYLSFFLKFTGVEGSQMVTCLIAFLVFLSIKANGDLEKIKKIRRYSTYLTILIVVLSMSLSIIPISLKAISMQGYYCYLDSDSSQGVILRYLIQIIPQFIYIFLMIFYSVYAYIKTYQNKSLFGKQFLFFPLVMMFSQVPIIIERLYEIVGNNNPITLWVDISYILLSLNGLFNTLIYGLCTDIFNIMKESLVKCCAGFCRKRQRIESDNQHLISLKSNVQHNNQYSAYTSIEDSLISQKKRSNNS